MVEKEELFEDINDELDTTEEETQDQEQEDIHSLYEHFRFVSDPGQSILRIDKFLNDRMLNTSRNKIQEAAANGSIMVNGVAVKVNYKVKPNDVITVELAYPKREITIIAEDIPLNIVYEDDYLLVVNKEPGMVVHPSYGHYTGTLINALAWHLKDNPLFNDQNDPRPGLVHRIDKNTSGLLVIAKTVEARTKLALQFFNKTSTRKYITMCWGDMKEDEGTIIGNIGRNLANRKIMDVFPEGEEYGKHAVTHWKVIERLGYVNLIECVLETGRTHQIRAHMKSIGHPIFNDWEYGGDQILKGTTFTKYKQFIINCFKNCPRQALHAKTLGFIHPETGEEMTFNSEIPTDMATLIEKWEGYISNREI